MQYKLSLKNKTLFTVPYGINLKCADNKYMFGSFYEIADCLIYNYNDVYYRFNVNTIEYGIGLICEKLPDAWYYKRHILVWYMFCMLNCLFEYPSNKLADYLTHARIDFAVLRNGTINQKLEELLSIIHI